MNVINYITQINFGFGALAALAAECKRVGVARPLLITDRGVRAAGLVDTVLSQLPGRAGVPVYDGTPGNPDEASVREALELYREHGCDGVVALGGGSPIDLAKAVAVLAAHGGALKDYAAIEGGAARITARTPPVVAIPTTAGTGSEVGRGSLIILDDGRKVGILSPHVVPKSAICDPELTLGLPPILTAATGMDAIAHCIETFLSPSFNPPAEGIALDGLQRACAHIERATANPSDRDARLNMMSASTQGALAFQKGLGSVHSLSHALGGLNPRLHHGTLNAILLPAVLAFNASAETVVANRKMARLAGAMALAAGSEVGPAIGSMTRRLGLPTTLSEMGVSADLIPAIVNGALADHSHKTNPRDASAADYESMLRQVM
ncbi:iron-containing alcohol dehydrogenase [Methylobacterium sp. EM32]|uniref:iron-containing alcohol dehydrogenase n=1 Tax=Methylobacterium sp. EM32 TaxID=3163481 RepID=UPI0033B55271